MSEQQRGHYTTADRLRSVLPRWIRHRLASAMRRLKLSYLRVNFLKTSIGFPIYLTFLALCAITNRHHGTPLRHRTARWVLRQVVATSESSQVPIWFYGGTMLGAIRTQNFAGRPGDIDVLLHAEDVSRFVDLLRRALLGAHGLPRFLSTSGLCRVEVWQKKKFPTPQRPELEKWYMRLWVGGVAATIVELIPMTRDRQGKSHVVSFPPTWREDRRVQLLWADFSAPRQTSICGVPIHVPARTEMYLEQMFGADWRVPAACVRRNSDKLGLGYSDPEMI